MTNSLSRRQFLEAAIAAGTCLPAASTLLSKRAFAETRSANEKLKLGVIGVAARGQANLEGVASEDIVVLCDIDEQRLAAAAEKYPNAKKYHDFHQVFEHNDLDGVVCSTPDHLHAFVIAEALKRGLPIYCEKPLTHSLYEARTIRRMAADSSSITQMGNQIHSGDNYRRVVEMIQGGVIGPVNRVHIWLGAGDTLQKVASQEPSAANYELWVGPAPFRPFNRDHYHFNWRYWWDFGGGNLSDFWCHYADLAFWALNLEAPTSIAAKGEKRDAEGRMPPSKIRVEYEFPARGEQPPVHLTWYQGGWQPEGAEVYDKNSAVLFEGENGRLLADYGSNKVFMQEGKEAKAVAPSIPNSPGQHQEWIAAVKAGGKPTCNFGYGAMLTESAHLGNISYRAGQQRIEWDAEQMKIPNLPTAEKLIRREYREGWKL